MQLLLMEATGNEQDSWSGEKGGTGLSETRQVQLKKAVGRTIYYKKY